MLLTKCSVLSHVQVIRRVQRSDMFGICSGRGRGRWLFGAPIWCVFPVAIAMVTVFLSNAQATSFGVSLARASLNTTPFSAQSVLDGVFTVAQASDGEETFRQACMVCHATDEFTGVRFSFRWSGLTAGDVFEVVSTLMPEDDPGSLRPDEYASVVAYMLNLNGYPSGTTPLPADLTALRRVRIEVAPAP